MTEYFREQVLRKRPYLRIEWCLAILALPFELKFRQMGAFGSGATPELFGKALRVITLSDGIMLHKAFADRGFVRRNP